MIAVRYHEATKHHFTRFARSLGRLDWATQPDPFRRYADAPVVELPRRVGTPSLDYERLYDPPGSGPAPIDVATIGEFLRCSLGLSAWKHHGTHRWALRVNPSSGNLHPTEGWILADTHLWHYAPDQHALESRALGPALPLPEGSFLVALSSVLWREAWKYGERAFRYCQHDVGHAIAALRHAATLLGWRLVVLPQWSDQELATVLGIDPKSLRVLSLDVGGNFGSRNRTFVEFGLVLWAARLLRRPVKYTASRSEAFLTDYQGRDLAVEAELALDAQAQVAPLIMAGETVEATIAVPIGAIAPTGQKYALTNQVRDFSHGNQHGFGGALTFISVWSQ